MKNKEMNQDLEEALRVLKKLLRKHYPKATFSVVPDVEDQEHINLIAQVGASDMNDVFDIVLPTIFKFQDKGVPIHVIPL